MLQSIPYTLVMAVDKQNVHSSGMGIITFQCKACIVAIPIIHRKFRSPIVTVVTERFPILNQKNIFLRLSQDCNFFPADFPPLPRRHIIRNQRLGTFHLKYRTTVNSLGSQIIIGNQAPPPPEFPWHQPPLIIINIKGRSHANLLIIINATSFICFIPRPIQYRQQHAGQNRDNRDHNEQLNQGKRVANPAKSLFFFHNFNSFRVESFETVLIILDFGMIENILNEEYYIYFLNFMEGRCARYSVR